MSVSDQVYLALIRPVLEYGHVLLIGCNKQKELAIERVQRERRELAAVKLLKAMLNADYPLHDLMFSEIGQSINCSLFLKIQKRTPALEVADFAEKSKMSGSRRTYRTLPLDVPHSPAERIALSRWTYRTLPQNVPHSPAGRTALSRRTYRTLPLDVPHSPAKRIALSRRTSRTLPREVPHSVLHSPAERPSKIDAYFVACAVSQHIHIESPGHTVDLEGVRILDTEQDFFKRGIEEAIYIRALQPSLNRDGGRYRLRTTFGNNHVSTGVGELDIGRGVDSGPRSQTR
ncbi:hypothetical protein Bbelb_021640 [Branchiostoma belcheri]|nr:hypothetical protein Bbelb_021640 [Branchiostoma belcheri]